VEAEPPIIPNETRGARGTDAPDAGTVDDVRALTRAFDLLTQTTRTLEESYRCLQARVGQLDKELAAKHHELAVTSDYLNNLLESMSDGVVAVDEDGVITTFNRAAGHVLQYTAEEVIGRTFREVFGREFSVPLGPGAMELLARDGAVVPVTERDSPLADRANRRIGAVKVFQDLRELESLREQVRRMDRLAAIGEMAATVAHEIRNPLGGIRGFAALLARDLGPDDPRARLVDKILTGTENLNRVVTELLEYTRPLEICLEPHSCHDLVQGAVSYLESDGESIHIDNRVPPGLRVLADTDKMRRVFLNILLNAAQSIEKEGRIDISADEERGTVVVAISDTGCGMTPEQASKSFSPFYTTKEKGTGLGLAIASRIVDGHGGSLRVKSEPGKGSTFSVELLQAE